MEVQDKLDTLSAAAQFDICGYSGPNRVERSPLRFIHKAALPGGGFVCLFKVLLTNVCTNDCAYCVNQVGRDCPRATFQPEEAGSGAVFELGHRGKCFPDDGENGNDGGNPAPAPSV
jgi:predicted DNA-binding helix-hairpin-helix protein